MQIFFLILSDYKGKSKTFSCWKIFIFGYTIEEGGGEGKPHQFSLQLVIYSQT